MFKKTYKNIIPIFFQKSVARLSWRICHTKSPGGTYHGKSYGEQKRVWRISLFVEGELLCFILQIFVFVGIVNQKLV